MVEKKIAEVEKKTTAEEKTTTKGKVAAKKDVTTDKAAEKKTTKKAATKKAAEKKTTTKKAAAKKPAGKKTTTKKVPKAVFVEYCGAQTKIDVESYEEKVKEIWLNDWKRLARDLKQIDIYIKPEDGKVYFVVNGTEHGAIDL